MISEHSIIVHIDGSSQGNPGPSGIGVWIKSDAGQTLTESNRYIGERTNNQAEYEALLDALRILKSKNQEWQLTPKTAITINTDSELLFYQITGKYKVRDFSIKKLYAEAVKLMKELPAIKMALIPREANRVCDRLAKKAISEMIKSGKVKRVSNQPKVRSLFTE